MFQMKTVRRRCLIALCGFAVCCGSTASFAAEADYTHRVLGLFQKDREDDLRKVTEELPGIDLVKADFETGLAVFRYDAEIVFPKQTTAEQMSQALDMQLRARSRGSFEATPLTGRDRKKLTKIEIGILGLDCKGCSYGAYLAVGKIDGVENATASFKTGKLTAWIDAKKTTRKFLEEALETKRVKLAAAAATD